MLTFRMPTSPRRASSEAHSFVHAFTARPKTAPNSIRGRAVALGDDENLARAETFTSPHRL